MTTSTDAAREEPAALIVFGLDEAGKAHASRFSASDAELAEKAAALMGMNVLRVETDEHRALAAKLPPGRVFASGRAFVPFVKAALYAPLAAAGGPPARVAASATKNPPTASPSPPEGTSMASGGAMPRPNAMSAWASIETDSLVLATTGPMEGWWEAVVVKVLGDIVTLKWRDFPDQPQFVRRRYKVALLWPKGK